MFFLVLFSPDIQNDESTNAVGDAVSKIAIATAMATGMWVCAYHDWILYVDWIRAR